MCKENSMVTARIPAMVGARRARITARVIACWRVELNITAGVFLTHFERVIGLIRFF